MQDKVCVFCFVSNKSSAFVQCLKCKESFHTVCVNQCIDKWVSSGRRKSTWKCDGCDTTRKCEHSPKENIVPPDVECNSVKCNNCESLIKQLISDLEKANGEISRLKGESKSLQLEPLEPPSHNTTDIWETAKTQGRKRRLYAEVVSPTTVPLRNKFEVLQEEDVEASSPKEDSSRSTVKNTGRHQKKRRKKILVVSDSHGRSCGQLLQEELGDSVECQVMCHPGAPFNVVANSAATQAASFEADCVIVLGGTNDFIGPDHQPKLDTSALCQIPVSTRVIISHVPFRFDRTKYNRSIDKVNKALDYFVSSQIPRCDFETMNLDSLNYNDYTNHGLHLNMKGKTKLCKIMADKIKTVCYLKPEIDDTVIDNTHVTSQTVLTPPVPHPTTPPLPSKSHRNNFLGQP